MSLAVSLARITADWLCTVGVILSEASGGGYTGVLVLRSALALLWLWLGLWLLFWV